MFLLMLAMELCAMKIHALSMTLLSPPGHLQLLLLQQHLQQPHET